MCYPWSAQTEGYVYILHFDRPLGNLDNPRAQAAHYCGFAEDLPARLAKHAAGKGAKLTAAAVAQGITYHVYAWPAQLRQEQLLKAAKRTHAFCPACAAARGRKARALPAVATQLALSIEELPAIDIAPRMDWLEMTITRDWRAARLPAPYGLEDDLL
jgi:predicted GIY-YIG superfamily endonuclease